MSSLKNVFLNLLLGIMVFSLTTYGDSNNSMPEKPDTNVTLTWQNNIKTAFEHAGGVSR